jgi:single-strand DNA-binding protein
MTVNKAILLGRLGQDPELRTTGGGQPVCNFTLATNESWFDKQANERKEKTTWHRCIVWGASGENCAKYLCKGSKVFVEGRIQTREWEDKDGNKRYTTEIVASSVQFLDTKGSGGGGGRRDEPKQEKSGGNFSDDMIPF